MIIAKNKFITMKFATAKERIVQYIDFKGIKISDFLRETGIKRGFLDKDKLKSAITDENIATIIATFPDMNVLWLITGNGEMLNKGTAVDMPSTSGPNKDLQIEYLQEIIDHYVALTDTLNSTIKTLRSNLSTPEQYVRPVQDIGRDNALGKKPKEEPV